MLPGSVGYYSLLVLPPRAAVAVRDNG
jgi:hypothetical protein